jgi:hypothetical protein
MTTIDPEAFGAAMGVLVRDAVAPLLGRIAALEAKPLPLPGVTQEQLDAAIKAAQPNPDFFKDTLEPLLVRLCEAEQKLAQPTPDVEDLVAKAVLALPPAITPDQVGAAVAKAVPGVEQFAAVIDPLLSRLAAVERHIAQPAPDIEALVSKAVASIPVPEAVKGDKGDSIKGDKGADGIGLAGAVIDRDGNLAITMTNGEVKSLGQVVGRDGSDGIGLEDFDMEFDGAAHEVVIRASCAGRRKELRYPAGGIRPGGYWRDGTLAKAGEVYTHDGSSFCAKNDTNEKPDAKSPSWVLMVRKGRDGERGPKGVDAVPPQPIKLGVGGG